MANRGAVMGLRSPTFSHQLIIVYFYAVSLTNSQSMTFFEQSINSLPPPLIQL